MHRFLTLACACAVTAGTPAIGATAHAAVIDAQFSGSVVSQIGTSFAIDAPISGTFSYDTATDAYLSFTVGGISVPADHASSAAITPDQYSALYEAQVSAVPLGAVNRSVVLDLEGLGPWSEVDPIALLRNGAELAANLDTAASSFGFYLGNADGTGVQSVTARLAHVEVSAVPEPTSAVLMLLGGAVVVAARRARRADA